MDEFKLPYLRSYTQILKYSQLEGIISFRSGSNMLHKLRLNKGNLCLKGSEHSSILEY